MQRTQVSRSKLALTLLAALGGGSVCGNCQTTFKDALVSGTRDYILNGLLSPENFVDLLSVEDDSETDSP